LFDFRSRNKNEMNDENEREKDRRADKFEIVVELLKGYNRIG